MKRTFGTIGLMASGSVLSVVPQTNAEPPRTEGKEQHRAFIGLPATRDEVRTFVEHLSADAVAEAVDDLLDRPHYGERRARRWLDVVRYAEANGSERDDDKPHAWRYRDNAIDALNRGD